MKIAPFTASSQKKVATSIGGGGKFGQLTLSTKSTLSNRHSIQCESDENIPTQMESNFQDTKDLFDDSNKNGRVGKTGHLSISTTPPFNNRFPIAPIQTIPQTPLSLQGVKELFNKPKSIVKKASGLARIPALRGNSYSDRENESKLESDFESDFDAVQISSVILTQIPTAANFSPLPSFQPRMGDPDQQVVPAAASAILPDPVATVPAGSQEVAPASSQILPASMSAPAAFQILSSSKA